MPLNTFLGLLTLQVGVCLVAVVYFTIAMLILSANIFDYQSIGDFPLNLVFMLLLVFMMILAGLLAFVSSYNEKRTVALASLVAISVMFCYWLVLSCFSLLGTRGQVESVCIEARCPESFWIASVSWRPYHSKNNYTFINDTAYFYPHYYRKHMEKPFIYVEHYVRKKRNDPNEVETSMNITAETGTGLGNVIQPRDILANLTEKNNNPTQLGEPSQKYFEGTGNKYKSVNDKYEQSDGIPFFGTILLLILNLAFIIFSALVVWSWASELDWQDYRVDDESMDMDEIS